MDAPAILPLQCGASVPAEAELSLRGFAEKAFGSSIGSIGKALRTHKTQKQTCAFQSHDQRRRSRRHGSSISHKSLEPSAHPSMNSSVNQMMPMSPYNQPPAAGPGDSCLPIDNCP
jgi:hypothetical protein